MVEKDVVEPWLWPQMCPEAGQLPDMLPQFLKATRNMFLYADTGFKSTDMKNDGRTNE